LLLDRGEPRLQTNPRGDLQALRAHEEQLLNSYGWVDQGAGVVHVPIDRAMQLIAQRGLPTAQQAATEAANGAGSSQKTPATKRPEKEKSSEQ
jgi:hypothetical protein